MCFDGSTNPAVLSIAVMGNQGKQSGIAWYQMMEITIHLVKLISNSDVMDQRLFVLLIGPKLYSIIYPWSMIMLTLQMVTCNTLPQSVQDGIIKWKHFLCDWPFVMGIHWIPLTMPRNTKLSCLLKGIGKINGTLSQQNTTICKPCQSFLDAPYNHLFWYHHICRSAKLC